MVISTIKELPIMKTDKLLKDYIVNDFKAILNKKMMILFAILFIVYTISDMGAVFFLIPLCFALIPFRRDEYQGRKNNEKTMIQARYLYSLLLLFAVIFISFFVSNIVSMFRGSIKDLIPASSILVMIVIFLLTAAILLPVFYLYGFRKGQYSLYILVIVFALLNLYKNKISLFNHMNGLIDKGPWYLYTVLGLLVGGAAYFISYMVSKRFSK